MANRIDASETFKTLAAVAALTLSSFSVTLAQTPATLGSGSGKSADAEWVTLSAAELEELIGPIALYPDDLIAIVLPASTFPLQIVQASRYLEQAETDSELEPDAAWDESVVALLNYPEVIELLNDDLDWTWTLGEAVVNQQPDVLTAVQAFRDRAYAAGNLATDERQEVVAADDGTITIAPADPEVIYVPYYDPARVVVRTHVPVYHYYPYAYPVYYYPYPYGYSFGSRLFWGVTTAFAIGWSDYYLHVHHHSHYGHPYYGYNYYTPWYARTNIYVNVNRVGSYYRWQPGYRHGGRPRHYARYDRLRDRRFTDVTRGTGARTGRMRDRQIIRNSEPRRDAIRTRDGRLQPNRVGDQRRSAESRPRLTDRSSIDRTRNGRLQPNRSRSQPRVGQTRPTLRARSVEERRVRRSPNRAARPTLGRTQLQRQARETPNGARYAARRPQLDRPSTRAVPDRNVAQNRGRMPNRPSLSTPPGSRSAGLLGRRAAPQRAPATRAARGGIHREQPIRPPTVRQARPNRAPAGNRGAYIRGAQARPQQNRAQPRAQQSRARMQPQRAAAPNRGSGQRSGARNNRRAR